MSRMHALGRVLAFDADVFEVAGVPEGVEVALDGSGIVVSPRWVKRRARIVSLGMRRLPMTRMSEIVSALRETGATIAEKGQRPKPLSVNLRKICGTEDLSCWIWELMLRRMTGKIGTPSLQPKSNFQLFRAGKPIL